MTINEFIKRLFEKGVITDNVSDNDCAEYKVKQGYAIRTLGTFPFYVYRIIVDDTCMVLQDYEHTCDTVLYYADDCNTVAVYKLEQIKL